MNAKACATVGARMAALIFGGRLPKFLRRGRGGRRPTEVHLQEVELAAMLALAVEEGWKRGCATGKGEPTPEGVTTAHGRLVALTPEAPKPAGPSASDVAQALRRLDGMVLGDPEIGRVQISCPQLQPHVPGDQKP